MRRAVWTMIAVSSLYADWDTDILSKGAELYDETREKTIRIYEETLLSLQGDKLDPQQERIRQLNEAWENVLDDLKEGAKLLEEEGRVPESTWIGRDKKDVQEDFNALLDRIVEALTQETLSYYQKRMERLRRLIEQNNETIARYREKRLVAPVKSGFATTKEDYTKKIEALQEKNDVLRRDTEALKVRLQKRFEAIGVTLSSEQIDVLLARVDGEDIIRMTLVIDTIRHMTEQIGKLMKESGENLEDAKRYYAMYQVLQELTVYVQQRYIDKCTYRYLPKIDALIRDAKVMIEETARLRGKEEDPQRRQVYARNVETLKQTLQAAQRYRYDLLQTCEKVKKAKKESEKNLALAKNTYQTVMLSSDLYRLIEQSSEEFLRIGQMQVPPIIPFENVQLQKAYTELTQKIK